MHLSIPGLDAGLYKRRCVGSYHLHQTLKQDSEHECTNTRTHRNATGMRPNPSPMLVLELLRQAMDLLLGQL